MTDQILLRLIQNGLSSSSVANSLVEVGAPWDSDIGDVIWVWVGRADGLILPLLLFQEEECNHPLEEELLLICET
jgi:methionyl-tRNA synthetase